LRNDTAPIVISLILLEGCYFVENWKMISWVFFVIIFFLDKKLSGWILDAGIFR
jgi:hypothetical protein